MEEQTTTNATTQDTGAEVTAQPEEQHAEAVQTTNGEPQQPTTESAESTAKQEQADYNAWLQAKGIDPTDPEALAKVANMALNSEKRMHETTSAAAELKKQLAQTPGPSVDTDNELVQQLAGDLTAMKLESAVDRFKSQVSLSDDQEQQMVQYLAENPAKGQLVKAGYLTLDDLYAMSVAAKVDTGALKQAGGKEALQQLANKQRATALPGHATTNAVAPAADDPFVKGFDS